MTDSTGLELTLATSLVGFVAAHLRYTVHTPTRIRISHFAIWMVGGYFGLMPWLAFFSAGRLPYRPATILIEAYFLVGLFLAGIWGSGRIVGARAQANHGDAPATVTSRFWKTLRSGATASVPIVLFFAVTSIALRLLVGFRYGHFMVQDHLDQRMPAIVGDLYQASETVTRAVFLWAAITLISYQRLRFFSAALLIILFLLGIPLGRTKILADVTTIIFLFLLFRGFSFRYLLYGIVPGLVLIAAVGFYDRVRYYRNGGVIGQGVGISRFVESVKLASLDLDSSRRLNATRQNYSTRPLDLMEFIMSVLTVQESNPNLAYMHGGAMLANLVHATPYVMFPEKRNWLQPEAYIKSHYALPTRIDMGSSWLVYGLADFGLFGGLVIGAIYGASLSLIELWAQMLSRKFPFTGLIIAGVGLLSALQVQELPCDLVVYLRDAAVLGIAAMFLSPFVSEPSYDPDADEAIQPENMDDDFVETRYSSENPHRF